MIQPLSEQFGTGFYSLTPVENSEGYRLEQVGRYFNYHFTTKNYQWPELSKPITARIDGFSPNLNKSLHLGHLRNLVLASSLSKILGNAESVAMLGAATGISPHAIDEFYEWIDLASYSTAITYDNDLTLEQADIETQVGDGEYAGALVWNGPKGLVPVRRAKGHLRGETLTYAAYDLIFAKTVQPTHYITGMEQQSHFESLGLKDRHLPMGLVLNANGKKMKSREIESVLSASDALKSVESCLKETQYKRLLAWNILAWNFASVTRPRDISFDPKAWSDPDRPGLYITYTYARIMSALNKTDLADIEKCEVEEQDLPILGMASYKEFYLDRARAKMDPSPIAQYAFSLSKSLTVAYHSEKIVGGRPSFRFALYRSAQILKEVMQLLSMHCLSKV